jgi:hypothetical protein
MDEATQFALEAANATPASPSSKPATARLDRITRAGLTGLSRALSQRTALEPASPVGSIWNPTNWPSFR